MNKTARQILEAEYGLWRQAKGQLGRFGRTFSQNKTSLEQVLKTKADDIAQLVHPFHYSQAYGAMEQDMDTTQNKLDILSAIAKNAFLRSPQAKEAFVSAVVDLGLPYRVATQNSSGALSFTKTQRFRTMVLLAIDARFRARMAA